MGAKEQGFHVTGQIESVRLLICTVNTEYTGR